LRAEAARTADAKPARRILAMALVLDEHPRVLAAPGGMDRQTLRDWMYFYNADGLAGLPGRQPRLAEAQLSEVVKGVEDGPDPKADGVVRWRCADLGDRIAYSSAGAQRRQASEAGFQQHLGASYAPDQP
jgi:hypothetical protein